MKTLREEYHEFSDKVIQKFKKIIEGKGRITILSYEDEEEITERGELLTYITNGGVNTDVYLISVGEEIGVEIFDIEEQELKYIGFNQLDSIFNKITVIEEVEKVLK